MTVSNEILTLIQRLYEVLIEMEHEYKSIRNDEEFIHTYSECISLKREFLVEVYADGRGNRKDSIISGNYLNKLMSLLEEARESADSAEVEDFNKEIDHILECCEFTIEKIFDKKIEELFCCDTPTLPDNLAGTYTCLECGNVTLQSKKEGRPEKEDEKHKSATYAAMKHFDTCFKNIFIGHEEHVEEEVIDEIKVFMKRDRKVRVAIEDVREYLKQITCAYGPKYNKLDAEIMEQVNGEKELRLSNKEYNFIKEFYLSIITVFYEINHKRNNTPNCAFFIKKIINLLYADIDDKKRQECNRLIFVQKENTVFKISKIWQDICKLIDIQQVEKDFEELLKNNKSQRNLTT